MSGRREVALRIGSAVVLLPGVIWLIQRSVATSAFLFALAAAIATWEYYRLVFRVLPLVAWLGVLGAAAVPLASAIAPMAPATVLATTAIALSMLAWASHLFVGPRERAPERVGHVLAGFLFTSAGFTALSILRAGSSGAAWVMVVLAASWGNDTIAYFGGRLFGRTRLSPISPHKTWEGAVAGLAGGTAILLVARSLIPLGLDTLDCVLLGFITGIAGPIGDLCKSMLKRAYDAKDSGHLIPGHGGVLDRIDSVLFNAMAVLLVRPLLAAIA